MNIELIKSLLTLRTALAFFGGIVIGWLLVELTRQARERIKEWKKSK